ncbi:adenylate/guanylate cyclase domain-containing protein [Actinotalea ferrariae]|uniref:adenylate/guanylate cyclase domain-containing protein n=1 Tax=Actinotalea ferrariae TaxID=1386098 RepID=UPI0027E03F9A|nr:adenylate/guanylate cyclase domain-containing protein [Actinotalea ferrariae]
MPPESVDPGREPAESSTLTRLEEQLLGGPRTLTLAQVADRLDADVEDLRLFWHTLGLPTGPIDAVEYAESDVEVLASLLEARDRYELSPRATVSLVRSIGHTTDRLVLWQVEALVEHLTDRYGLDDTSARIAVLDRVTEIAPLLERQLLHAWRRQVVAIAGRFAQEFGGAHTTGDGDQLPLARAVGFADIVSFTTRTAALGAHELAEFVQTFETRARDVVTAAGGRVVKTIGDAVLFVADDPGLGTEVALGLASAFGVDSPTPVRVALVWGRVLSRFGDVFGSAVNLAARLTEQAEPGTVLLDEATATVVEQSVPGVVLTPQDEREVPGLGRLRPVRMSRADDGDA